MITEQDKIDIKSYPLLLLGEEWQIDDALNNYQGSLKEYIHTYTYNAFNRLKNINQLIEKCDFIAVFYSEKFTSSFFEMISEVKHKSEFILLSDNCEIDFKKVINEWGVHKIIDYSDFKSSHWSGNNEIVDRIAKKNEKRAIIKKTIDQKKQLDDLIQKQELNVSEKTSDIELSNKKQDIKLRKERVILRFIKDLSLVNSYEDFLRIIRNEFKCFHELGEIILLRQFSSEQVGLLSHQNLYQWKNIDKFNSKIFSFSEDNTSDLSEDFANMLSRPFGKVFITPLNNSFHIAFENQFSETIFREFKEFFEDRRETIFMAHDKLYYEINLNQFSYRWEKTFDAISEPIAIIDDKFKVLRSNLAFEKNSHSSRCYELFAGLDSVCPGCPLQETIETQESIKRDIIVNGRNYQLYSYPMDSKTE
ncbi:MAG: hypothetical protein KDD45_16535, partial [Bdellovibrionales bacterium]|nr:hypothetical protein [Bdellovibrionales bacterium]